MKGKFLAIFEYLDHFESFKRFYLPNAVYFLFGKYYYSTRKNYILYARKIMRCPNFG